MPEVSTAAINAALARWDGWTFIPSGPVVGGHWFVDRWSRGENENLYWCPDYSADLNLIHGLEEKLTEEHWMFYQAFIGDDSWTLGTYFRNVRHASAEQCARALYAICPEEHKR